MPLILSADQARNILCSMHELNKIGAILHARILQRGMTIHVQEYLTDEVNVWVGDRPGNPVGGVERYTNQKSFAEAYGLL